MSNIIISGKSDVGLKRTNNEDTFVLSHDFRFGLVADGMGGAAAGELASRIFAETAIDHFSGSVSRTESETVDLVQKVFSIANQSILDHIDENAHHKGMGCTAELIAFYEQGFVVGHIGDSRTYRLRNGQLKQLTRDHSLVQDQIDQGMIAPEDARSHMFSNVILRAIGVNEKLELDLLHGKMFSGDIFLLCSDGLTDMVDDASIHKVLVSDISLRQKTDRLIGSALNAGGHDNITVVLCEIELP